MATDKNERPGAGPDADAGSRYQAYDLGAPVWCADGPCGELARLVVDPGKRVVTQLVVEPRHQHGLARLVPVAMVQVDGTRLRLRCALATFRALEYAEEIELLPIDPVSMSPGYPGEGTLVWPYEVPRETPVPHERIPSGEVEIRRGEHVHAENGAIGRIQGLIVDAADQRVSHVLLQEGHLWGAKQVAIPIGAVTAIDLGGVHVALSKREIGGLPEVGVRPAARAQD